MEILDKTTATKEQKNLLLHLVCPAQEWSSILRGNWLLVHKAPLYHHLTAVTGTLSGMFWTLILFLLMFFFKGNTCFWAFYFIYSVLTLFFLMLIGPYLLYFLLSKKNTLFLIFWGFFESDIHIWTGMDIPMWLNIRGSLFLQSIDSKAVK